MASTASHINSTTSGNSGDAGESDSAHVENRIKYMTPATRDDKLLEASTAGDLECVLLLLKHNADLKHTDSGGNTPLHRASWKGRHDVVEVLLANGAEIEAGTLMGNTSLHRASYNGHTKVVKILLDHGADIESRCRYGHTAMFAAAHYGHLSTLEYLISRDADMDARNDLGQTALHVVSHKCQRNSEEIIDCLLEAGIDIEATEDQGYTAMHSAAYFGRIDCVEYLIERNADMEARGHHGFTPLLSATLGMKHNIIVKLLELGADWTVESTGPEGILDVLDRARQSEGYSDRQEEWHRCRDMIEKWTNSSKEEIVLQYMFKKLLHIPGKRMTEFSGWMQSDEVYLDMANFVHVTSICQEIGESLARQHGPAPRISHQSSGTQTISSWNAVGTHERSIIPEMVEPSTTSPNHKLNRVTATPRKNIPPGRCVLNEATGRDENYDDERDQVSDSEMNVDSNVESAVISKRSSKRSLNNGGAGDRPAKRRRVLA